MKPDGSQPDAQVFKRRAAFIVVLYNGINKSIKSCEMGSKNMWFYIRFRQNGSALRESD